MAAQNFLLHVHTSTDIDSVFTSRICEWAKENDKRKPKKLNFDYNLSYEDPDFDGQLRSLVDIEEHPQNVVLKAVWSKTDASSVELGNKTLPHDVIPDRAERWPNIFSVPTFSYKVSLLFGEENATYEKTGKTLKLFRVNYHFEGIILTILI